MANFGRSLKPTMFLTSMGRRPGMPGRSLSNTSEVSSTASSPGEFNSDDILFSAKPSPAGTPGGPRRAVGETHMKTVAQDPALRAPSDAEADADSPSSLIPLDSPSSSVRSRPIAIELPVPKKITSSNHSSSVYTPPAPLSARGDLPGGYFPLHEDQSRVYHGHPFQADASRARKRSIQLASQANPLETHMLKSEPAAPVQIIEPRPAAQYFPITASGPPLSSPAPTTDGMSPSRSTTPVASYIPSGVHASPLPMGKYYPSNYEKRKEDKRQQTIRPSPSGILPTSVKSDSQVPTYRSDSSMGHSRNESEAKRRLQQYQRDMIAQATLALNGGNVNAAAMNAISLRNMGFTSLNTKPSKPRLVPLGSPGPVTPMELESSDDGYLGARVPASANGPQIEEIARAIRIEEERRRREGPGSPAIELGPAC